MDRPTPPPPAWCWSPLSEAHMYKWVQKRPISLVVRPGDLAKIKKKLQSSKNQPHGNMGMPIYRGSVNCIEGWEQRTLKIHSAQEGT